MAISSTFLYLALVVAALFASATQNPVHSQDLEALFPGQGALVIADNDDHRDVYTDEYLLALAHLGEIELKGLITTYAPNAREYELFVEGRSRIVELAAQSGLQHLPRAMAGTEQRLSRPASNRIEDTEPLDLPASRFIVEQAQRASQRHPLILVTGGQLTTIANAYLLAPSIADNVVVSGVFGASSRDYNAGLDAWAWTIVLAKFRVFAVPIGPSDNRGAVYMKPPYVPKAQIEEELPLAEPFFAWMYEKNHPSNPLPDEHDFDGQAAVPLLRPDYITDIQRWRFERISEGGDPILQKDPEGAIYEALDANQDVATEEFWRAMRALSGVLK